jgi:hypothetical protein
MFPRHRHHHETLPNDLASLFRARDVGQLKVDLWNAFAHSKLLGINDHDCSALPRILPASYLPNIRRTCRDFTETLMRILSLPGDKMRKLLPPTPISDYLIDQLGVLAHRHNRLTGSLRFDMAIVGPAGPNNPPKLMEVNDIGFDGTGRSSFIQSTILKLFPALRQKVLCLDTAASEIRNMRRLGRHFVRFQYEMYNWEEEVLLMKAARAGLDMRMVSPAAFRVDLDEDCTQLTRERIRVENGRIVVGKDHPPPNAFQLAYSFELKDFEEAPTLFRTLIRSRTHQYSPFITGLIATKTILTVLGEQGTLAHFLGKARADRLMRSIVPARLLDGNEAMARRQADRLVLKFADGMGGEHVFVGRDLLGRIAHIPKAERKYWVLQDRIDLNTIDVSGFLSRPRRVVADLGAYIHYDWNGKRFTHFNVGGFITRATSRGFKVNVSGGGLQVPVMFDRSR